MIELIMERNGCNRAQAAMISEDLGRLDPRLRPLLDAWITDGKEDDDTLYEGYSVNSLKDGMHMRFTGALLTLDWLLRDPQTARKALARGVL